MDKATQGATLVHNIETLEKYLQNVTTGKVTIILQLARGTGTYSENELRACTGPDHFDVIRDVTHTLLMASIKKAIDTNKEALTAL